MLGGRALTGKPPRRVIIYIPNIEELAWMGTWSKSDANVATAMAPFIERGDLPGLTALREGSG